MPADIAATEGRGGIRKDPFSGEEKMTTNYDPIAEQYQRAKHQPWRAYLEAFGLMGLIGDPAGQSILDLACGEGFYSRMLRRRGAAKVVGVDLSEEMIALARRQESEMGLGIEYIQGDARSLMVSQSFDLVVAAYLLNYARDREELKAMCEGIARSLKPGGRFVTVNTSATLNFAAAPSYRQYGFETRVLGPWKEGVPIRWTFHLGDGSFEIENYHLDRAIHEDAFTSAGFRDIRWHDPGLCPEGIAAFEVGFWTTFLDHPPISLIECVKCPIP
jgi:ubiquinone/menaquinone biosynthesis C-methylase UbiE